MGGEWETLTEADIGGTGTASEALFSGDWEGFKANSPGYKLLFGDGSNSDLNTTRIPPWMIPHAMDVLDRGQTIADREYTAYQGDRYAPMSEGERQAYGALKGQDFGSYLEKGGQSLQSAGQDFTSADMDAYMSPYIEQALDPTAREIDERTQRRRLESGDRAAQTGAFGGSRHAILESENIEKGNQEIGDLYSEGYHRAYQDAAGRWRGDREMDLRAGQAMTGYGQQGIQGLTKLGGIERGIEQAEREFDYGQFQEERDWDVTNFQHYVDALSRTPHGSETDPPDPNRAGQTAGLISAIAGLFSAFSDKNAKKNIKPMEEGSALAAIEAADPNQTWQYKGDDTTHMGPMAQDMKSGAGIGTGKSIPLMDAVNLTMAGVNELNRKVDTYLGEGVAGEAREA